MNFWKLRFSMFGTLTVIIAISTVFFAAILGYLGLLNILSLGMVVALFNIVQWLFAPHLINSLYRVREVKAEDAPGLYRMVDRLSAESGVRRPKIGIAKISIPNAFAYGSPIAGNSVAVTQGLLDTLEEEEVEAVLAHEFGHLKHRDVQIMMLVSFLPSLFYILGRSAMFSAYYEDRRRGNGSYLVGAFSMFVYFILMLLTLSLSRFREYYADSHGASIIEDGPRKLSEGLAKIALQTRKMRLNLHREAFMFNGFKSLFISDPDTAVVDSAQLVRYTQRPDRALVERLVRRRVTFADAFLELFSTHPNITKRLNALQAMGI